MSLNVSADLVPTGGGAWPTHTDAYGKGGFRTVADNTARDAISSLRRSEGMLVYIIATGNTYRLGAGLTNADWALQSSGSITAGNGLTGTTTLSVLANGATLNVSASGVKVATSGITGNELAAASVDLASAKVTGILPGSMVAPDFVAQDIQTTGNWLVKTGYVRWGLAAGSGGGVRSSASQGDMRLPRGGWAMWGRNDLDSADVLLQNWDSVNNRYVIGDASALSTGYIYLQPNFVILRVGTNAVLNVGTSKISPLVNTLAWDTTLATAPILTQDDNTGGGGGTVGRKMIVRAQSCTGPTSTGGAYDCGPGSGTTAGGLGRCVSGSGVARFSYNDTGWATDGVTPVAQPARVGQLGDATTGVAGGTVGDVGAVFNQSILNNMHKTFLDKINSLELIIHNRGISA